MHADGGGTHWLGSFLTFSGRAWHCHGMKEETETETTEDRLYMCGWGCVLGGRNTCLKAKCNRLGFAMCCNPSAASLDSRTQERQKQKRVSNNMPEGQRERTWMSASSCPLQRRWIFPSTVLLLPCPTDCLQSPPSLLLLLSPPDERCRVTGTRALQKRAAIKEHG